MADYDPTTDLGYLRMLVSDTSTNGQDQVFTDNEILTLIAREGSIKGAAAQAMEIIADNEALVAKVIRTQDLSTDGAKTATALRARAAQLRAEADRDEARTGRGGYDVIAFEPYPTAPVPESNEHYA